MQKETQRLIDEINRLTLRIESEYPELYMHLEELPNYDRKRSGITD